MSEFQQRVASISLSMLDAIEAVLATLQPAAPSPPPPPAVARRQLANSLGLWNFCANRRCRRARCCRGEPSHCLRTALPLLPPELAAGLRARKRR